MLISFPFKGSAGAVLSFKTASAVTFSYILFLSVFADCSGSAECSSGFDALSLHPTGMFWLDYPSFSIFHPTFRFRDSKFLKPVGVMTMAVISFLIKISSRQIVKLW